MKTPCSTRVATQDEFCSTSVSLSGKGSVFTTLLWFNIRTVDVAHVPKLTVERAQTHKRTHTQFPKCLLSLSKPESVWAFSLSLPLWGLPFLNWTLFFFFLLFFFLSPRVVIGHSCGANLNAASPFNFDNIWSHYVLTACLLDCRKCNPTDPKSSI